LYTFIKTCINLRKDCPEVGEGEWQVLDTGTDGVLAILYRLGNRRLLFAIILATSHKTQTLN
jgi:maltose alpha-D-glucosyltransferase/alpha-amylase